MSTTALLSRAPLIHVVAQLQFSRLPAFDEAELADLHRRLMDQFPERIDAFASVEESAGAGAEMTFSRTSPVRVVFKASGQQQLVELHRDRILMKVTDYQGHQAFFAAWSRLMETITSALSHIQQALLHRFSLRYVDLIVPGEGEALADLVSGALLPPPLTQLEGDPLFGASVKVIRTAPQQHLWVGFEEILPESERLTKVLPDDLMEHDARCELRIQAGPHWHEVKHSYGLLDIDHVHIPADTPVLEDVDTSAILQALYQPARTTFDSVITDAARKSWE